VTQDQRDDASDTWREVAPHVYEHIETRHRVLSAEKTWELLRENLRRALDRAMRA